MKNKQTTLHERWAMISNTENGGIGFSGNPDPNAQVKLEGFSEEQLTQLFGKGTTGVAKTFNEILKFNPYHDSRDRFASANGAASFTYSPGKSKAHDNSLEYAVVSSKQTKIIKSTDDLQQFNIMKTDDDKRLIFGWASVAIKVDGEQVIDHQKDMIDPDDLEEAVYEYVLNFRDGGEEHIPNLRKKARMVESCMFTKEKMQAMGIPEGIVPEGWWIGFYVDDDDAWEKVKSGIYQMFSIEGQGVREEIEDNEDA